MVGRAAMIVRLRRQDGREETQRPIGEAAEGRGRQEGDRGISRSRRGGRCQYGAVARVAARAPGRRGGRYPGAETRQEKARQKSQILIWPSLHRALGCRL